MYNYIIKIFIFLFLILTNLYSADLHLTKQELEYLKNNPTIKVHNELDWAPFNYNRDGVPLGWSIDYMDLIAQKLNIKVKYVHGYTWNQFMEMIKNNQIDVMLNIAKTEEREKFLTFTSSYFRVVDTVFTQKNTQKYESLEELNGKSVVVVKGFYEEEFLAIHYPLIKVVVADSSVEALKLVSFGKADAAVNNYAAGSYLIKEYALHNMESNFEVKDKRFSLDLNIATNKNNTILRDIIEKAKQSIKKDELSKLRDNYQDIFRNNNRLILTENEKKFLLKHPRITLGTGDSWAPYIIPTSDGKTIGYDNDILTLINRATGANFTQKAGNWIEIQEDAKNKKIDGLSTLIRTKEREKWLNFSNIYISLPKNLMVKQGNPLNIKSEKDLVGKKIVIIKGVKADEIISKRFKNSEIIYASSYKELLTMINSGKADATFGNGTLNYSIRLWELPYLDSVFNLNSNLNLRFAVRKDWPEAISILNKGLERISQYERLQLEQKWFFEKGRKTINFTKNIQNYLINKKTITMCIDPMWMPFEKLEKNKHIGIASDFFKLFEEKIGKKVELIPTKNWSQSLEFAKQRKCDIVSLAMPTPMRKKYLNFTTPYINAPIVIATRNDIPFINDLNKVMDKKLGIVKGYSINETFKKLYPNINIVSVDSIKEGLKKVESGEIFGYLDNSIVIDYQIQNNYLGTIAISGKFDGKWELGVGVRNDEPLLLEIFNQVINSISERERQTILNKWVNTYNQVKINYELIWQIVFISMIIILGTIYWNRKLSLLNKKLVEEKEKVQRSLDEQKKLEKDLIKAKELAEKHTKIKSEFLANMSHEIRTPMNGILGMCHLVLNSELTTKQKKHIQNIDISAKNLLSIINDILDFSKIEAGKLIIEKKSFNIQDMIDSVVNIFEYQIEQKKLKFNINCNETLNKNVYGDQLRLTQVLTNLLSNAIKFTFVGEVSLNISKTDSNRYRFEIIDTGIGINKKNQEDLFQSFHQADTSTTKKFGGTGLGLIISKQLVELMNGTIWYESEENIGSKFYFELELLTAKEKKIEQHPSILNSDIEVLELKANDILLAEDNEINQQVIIGLLEKSNINIDIANNGEEAIQKVKEKNYALILMDIQMPILDGYEATKQIRKMDINIPIIALSANAMQQNIDKSIEVGMNAHITKPIDIEVLCKTLIKYIPIKTDNIINNHNENKDTNISNLQHVNINIGMKYMSNNENLYHKIINSFIKEYVNISIDNLDEKELEIFMHTIKNTSANIGAVKLSKIAAKIEITLDKSLLKEFSKQLQFVLLDLEKIQYNDTKKISKPMIKEEDRDILFQSLYKALQTNRPQSCIDIIEELNNYLLSKKDYEVFVEIKKAIEKYNFKDAITAIEKIVKN